MKRILCAAVSAVGVILLPLFVAGGGTIGRVPVAQAASGPPTVLTGETFLPGTFTLGGNCELLDVTSTDLSFTASGAAVGPVPGTYTESGTLTIGVVGPNVTMVQALSGTFSIKDATGQTVATGQIDLANQQPLTSMGYCFFSQANVDAIVDYDATVNGNELTGQAELAITPNGPPSPTNYNFQQTFLSSSTVSCFTSIAMPFNGIPIPPGYTIWMPAALQIQGQPSTSPVTVTFTNQTLTFNIDGAQYVQHPPNATVTFQPLATTAKALYDDAANTWSTEAPSTVGGKVFLTGIGVPSPGMPGSVKPVTWSGQITPDTPGVTVHWQWGAAVYTTFSQEYNSANVKAATDPTAAPDQDGDNDNEDAGTPDSFEQFVTGGARGGGGENYTGSWSAVASCKT